MITVYKATRHDGTDYRTGKLLYKVGETLTVANPDPAGTGCCRPGLHVSPTARMTCQYIETHKRGPRARFFECHVKDEDVLDRETTKLRVRSLYVAREVPFEEVFGEDVVARIATIRAETATWRRISWLKPTRNLTDEELTALFLRWHAALSPWLPAHKTPLPTTVRIVRAAADAADAADAAAAAAAADAAAAAADAADAADAAAADAAAAAADAAAADAADAANADLYRLWPYWLRWYVTPRYVLWRSVRWRIAGLTQPNPWEPLFEMFRLGAAPIGYRVGASGPEFVIYAPPPT